MANAKRSGIERYADFIVARNKQVLVGCLLAVLIGAIGALQLSIQTTFRVWLHDDDPVLVNYESMTSTFGSDDTLLVAFSDDQGILHNENLLSIDRLTEKFLALESVKRVDSLTNFKILKATPPELESPALAVSKQWVAASDDSDNILLFDRNSQQSYQLEGHEGLVEHIYIDEDRDLLLSASIDRSLRIWSLKDKKTRSILRGLPESISSILVTDKSIYAGSLGTIGIWERETGKPIAITKTGTNFVSALEINSQGNLVSGARTVDLRDPNDATLVKTLASHKKPVTKLANLGSNIISASADGSVIASSVSGSSKTLVSSSSTAVTALAISNQPNTFHVGMANGTIHTISVEQGHHRSQKVHREAVLDIVEGSNGRIYTGSIDQDIAVINKNSVTLLKAHRGIVRRVVISPDAKSLFTSGDDGVVYQWALETDNIRLNGALNRKQTPPPASTTPIPGTKDGQIQITNLYRHPIEIRINGESYGEIGAETSKTLPGISIGPRTSCDDGCLAGQECDYEEVEPVCTNPVTVEALLGGTNSRLWTNLVYVSAEPKQLRVPLSDTLALQDVAESPYPDYSRVGPFREKFPDPAVKKAFSKVLPEGLTDDDSFFISPNFAKQVLAELEDSHPASKLLEELSRARVTQYRLPIQPFRIAEAQYHLLRPPVPPGQGFVINDALDTTMIHVNVTEGESYVSLDTAVRIKEQVEGLLEEEAQHTNLKYHVTGDTTLDASRKQMLDRRQRTVDPLFLILPFLFLGALFRRPAGILLPLVTVLLAVAFSFGTAGHLQATLNELTSAAPLVTLIICLGDAVHMFTTYTQGIRRGLSSIDSTKLSICENFIPVLLTTVTTMLGMLSLVPSGVRPISEFGWMVALGTSAAFLVSLTALPAVMSLLPTPQTKSATLSAKSRVRAVESALSKWGTLVTRYPKTVAIVSTLMVAGGVFGSTLAYFDTNPIRDFKPGSEFRIASEYVEEKISGSVGVEFVLDSKQKNGLRKVEVLREIEKIQNKILETNQVRKVVSISDTYKGLRRTFNGDREQEFALPETDETASAYYNAYTFSLPAGFEINNRVSEDESQTRISVRLNGMSSGWAIEWQQAMLDYIKAETTLDAKVTGKYMLYCNFSDELAKSFLWNVALALALICISMIITLRSFRLGLISMIPNAVPSVLAMGVLGYMNHPLDISIVVSLCVALGVVVDDTVHFLTKFQSYRQSHNVDDSIVKTFSHTGVALTFTTVVLVLAFSVFMTTDYQMTSNFGFVTAIILVFGLLLDFTLTPALMKLTERDPNHHQGADTRP